MNPFQPVKDLESEIGRYTGAPYVVSVTSCTMALLLAVAWKLRNHPTAIRSYVGGPDPDYQPEAFAKRTDYTIIHVAPEKISIPKRTYVSVPQSILHAGGHPVFRDEIWAGGYELKPLRVWDFAKRFTGGMYEPGEFQCVSFHTSKVLGDTQGGAILHDNGAADQWLRKARFDGRTEGVEPSADIFDMVGWHCYLSPDVAARLVWRMARLPAKNPDLPTDDYPDLSKLEIFK